MEVLSARSWRVWLAVFLLLGCCLGAAAAEPPAPAASAPTALQVFVRDGCPYCADAKAFLDGVQRQRPELHIAYRRVDTDPVARDELNALSQAHGIWPPGLPAIYTAVLAQQQLGTAAHLAYLGLYIVGYIADDALMVTVAVLALSQGKLTERAGRGLKLLSGVVMLALGLVLLFRPEWLV